MHATMPRVELLAALDRIRHVAGNCASGAKRHADDYRAYVALSARDGTVTLTATDDVAFVQATLPAEVAACGEAAVRIYELRRALRTATGPRVTVHGSAVVVDGTVRDEVVVRADAYAFPDARDATLVATVEARDLARVLRTVQPAMGRDDTRPSLYGCYLRGSASQVRAVASDGAMLVESAAIPATAEVAWGVLLKPQAAEALAGMLARRSGPVRVLRHPQWHCLLFQHDRDVVGAVTLDAVFPDYERVLPKVTRETCVVTVDRVAVAKALAGMRSDNTAGVRMTVADGRLQFTAWTGPKGEWKAWTGGCAVRAVRGPVAEVAVDATRLSIAAMTMSSETVDIAWGKHRAGVRVDGGDLAVVAEMRL